MHKIPTDLLKNNLNYLKSCILYEVLSKKPIFDSYRHFCETNGDDAIGYNDFEYWYYRFYSGDIDFEHERRIDSKEKALTGLPLEILGMVTGYLEPEERTHLRLMSKKFKAIVDMEHVTFRLIDVEWTPNVFRLYINENYFEYIIHNGRFVRKDYSDEGLESALDRFAQVMKHPKLHVDRLILKFSDDVLPEEKEQLLKCLPHSLHVEQAHVYGSVEDTLTIVSHLKPGVLKGILVTGCPQELAPIFESEHWKQAELTKLFSCQTTSRIFPMFYSFRYFDILVTSMEMNDLHLLISNVAKNPSFQCCIIKAVTVTSHEIEEPIPIEERIENDGSLRLRYQIPDSKHYLEIHMRNDGFYTIRRI
ncbi:hypothetical protein GCK72_021714 [Caenorhabditis remanei]|uniref:F-box domain-containing protein n=1 Tax=Caenorhabditis remanei TaxID=31234 RepID=A0A6A5GKT6_CAERE|nr:hypothetical protein GCK72_021714 [Caenorhabditis remanei]KAF1755145.1 hypothetical protein GCK72_021714 [Caenorhabditis remanei]